MKLTLWQQFSSNHSNHFWIAGTFKTVEETDAAYGALREMLLTIDQWHRDHPEESKAVRMNNDQLPTPVEMEFASKYDVTWTRTLDWMNVAYYLPPAELDRPLDWVLKVAGHTIVMTNPGETWGGGEPFEALLKRFGASVVGYDFHQREAGIARDVRLDLTCNAPDESTAAAIEQAVRAYLSNPLASDGNPPPWHNDAENFEKAYLRSDLLRREHVERLTRSWERYFNLNHNDFALKQLRLEGLALERGAFRRDGLQLTFEDIWFAELTFALALSALIAWLIVNNCTVITPQFSAVEHRS